MTRNPTTVGSQATGRHGATSTVTQIGTNTNLADVFAAAYTLTNLPVGNTRIRFVDLNGVDTDEYHDNSPDHAGATPVPITAGSATPNANAALTPTG